MKKLISLLFIISILAVMPFMNGCKKGAEDPFISLKSRDGRITRTWVLSEMLEEKEVVTDYVQDNDINSDEYTSTKTQVYDNGYDGSSLTEYEEFVIETQNQYTQYNWLGSNFINYIDNTKSEKYYTFTYDYTVSVQIDDDNTYTATYSKTLKGKKESGLITPPDGISYPSPTIDVDTAYTSSLDVEEWVEEGDWFWLDANDNKVIIYAGPMQGKLLKLSSSEIIIEDMTIESDDNTDYGTGSSLYTYDDTTDGYKTEDGFVKEVTNVTTERTYKATWVEKE